MKVENVNTALREIFQEMVDDGHKKRHICGLTLGSQAEPQFDSFLKGSEFGFKPLQRLIQNMGYELNIIITSEETPQETVNMIEEANNEFLSTYKELLATRLNDDTIVTPSYTAKSGVIVDISNEIFDEITKDVS